MKRASELENTIPDTKIPQPNITPKASAALQKRRVVNNIAKTAQTLTVEPTRKKDPFINLPSQRITLSPMHFQATPNTFRTIKQVAPRKLSVKIQQQHQPAQMTTQKRLGGLLQLLERDLDGKKRNLQSQINKVDSVRIMASEATPKGRPVKLKVKDGVNKILAYQDVLILNRSTLQTSPSPNKERERDKSNQIHNQSQVLSIGDDERQTRSIDSQRYQQISPLQIISERDHYQNTFTFLLLRLFEAFRGQIYQYCLEQMALSQTESIDEDELFEQCESGALFFAFLTFVHQKLYHKPYRRHLTSQGCQCGCEQTMMQQSPTKTQQQRHNHHITAKESTEKTKMKVTLNLDLYASSSQVLTKDIANQNLSSNRQSMHQTQQQIQQRPKSSSQLVSNESAANDSFCSEQVFSGELADYNLQFNQRKEEKMLNHHRTPQTHQNHNSNAQQFVSGQNNSSKQKKNSIPHVSSAGQQACITGGAIFPARNESCDYTPRTIARQEPKNNGKIGARAKLNSQQHKKDIRVSQKGFLITATNNFKTDSLQAKKNNTLISSENMMAKGNANNCRNDNILRNSLQMLSGAGTIDSQNVTIHGNNNFQQAFSSKQDLSQERGFHLRYVSQGLQQSHSIEGPPLGQQKLSTMNRPSFNTSSKAQHLQQLQQHQQQPSMRQQNILPSQTRQSLDNMMLLPSKSINERLPSSKQLEEQKTIQAASMNTRRIGGASQNNLPSQQPPPLVSRHHGQWGGKVSEETLMPPPRSLNVTSTQNQISLDSQAKQQQSLQVSSMNQMQQTMTFQTSEYGPVTQQHSAVSDKNKTFSQSFNLNNSNNQNTLVGQGTKTSYTSKDRKNVPLMVMNNNNSTQQQQIDTGTTSNEKTSQQNNQQRFQQMLPSDYLVSSTASMMNQKQLHASAQIMSGGTTTQGFRSTTGENNNNMTTTTNMSSIGLNQMPPVIIKSSQPTNAFTTFNSNTNNPKGSQLMATGRSENQKVNLLFEQRGQGRSDKIKNRQQQKSSNQSFQSALPESQVNGANQFSKQNLERALKTAQMGNTQRTRGNQLESNYNIWEAPLTQKFDLGSQAETQSRDPSLSTRDQQLVLMHNVTPGQGRKPDFRQSTALPKTYKQFVATVNSGGPMQQSSQNLSQQPTTKSQTNNSNSDPISVYKTSFMNFQNGGGNYDGKGDLRQFSRDQLLQAGITASQQKKIKKSQKDEVLKMISQLELGDNTDTFRHLAKQFYKQNLQSKASNNPLLSSSGQQSQQRNSNKGPPPPQQTNNQSLEASTRIKEDKLQSQQQPQQQFLQDEQSNFQVMSIGKKKQSNEVLTSKNGLQLTPVTQQSKQMIGMGTSTATPNKINSKALVDQKQTPAQISEIQVLQKQLWQQFQLLRILKQTKYQQLLQKHQSRGDGSQPKTGPPGSQSIEYGFELTEEEMYTRLFLSQESGVAKKDKHDKKGDTDDSQPYASFDCPECVQMASLMLEEELRYYMQRNQHKRSKGGKSRDALYRFNGNNGGQPLKGIAGLSTTGVSLRNQKLDEDTNSFQNPQEYGGATKSNHGKRQRAQTQQNQGGKRGSQVGDDPSMIGQIVVSRAQPQFFFKKQHNPNFRQVIRGEQLTTHNKQQQMHPPLQGQQMMTGVCTCRQGPYQSQSKNGKQQFCTCGANSHMKPNYVDPSIAFQYGFQQRAIKPKMTSHNKTNHGKSAHGQSSQVGGTNNEGATNTQSTINANYGQGNEPKLALDGTVTGHKRKYKPACGIFQPPLQPFKHLNQSPINQTISKVNDLVLILFKQKMKSSDQQIIKLFKYFSIPIPRGNGCVLDQKLIKMPDFLHSVNQKLLIKLYKVFNQENAGVKPEQSTQIFRFYVGKGNNYPSVRQIISRRTWWNRGNQKQEKFYGQKLQGYSESEEVAISKVGELNASTDELPMSSKQFASGCHFVWTQWRKTEHHEFLRRVNIDQQKQKANDALFKKTGPKKKKIQQNQVDPSLLQSAPLASIPTLIYNRLDDNYHLSNKKALFLNVSTYYQAMGINPFEVAIPLTFNVKTPHNNDQEYIKFTRAYKQFEQQKDANIWIIKPGENSNRGTGIQVAQSFNEIKTIIQQLSSKNGNRTSIVQKYLDKPLLINNRKFDIRGYAMITSTGGVIKGYMYRDCYFRTSSKQFDLNNLHSRYVHLTNDAIQMNSEDYGRFESGNKLSINDFQRYLDANHSSKNVCFMRDLFPQMERLVTDSFRAVGSKIDPKRIGNCFEIFGYDFMIDENFKVYLIEANTNPCLEICSPLLARIIPELLDNSFRIAIDPLYQPSQFLAKLKEDGTDNNSSTQAAFRDCSVGVPVAKDKQNATEGVKPDDDHDQSSPNAPKRQKDNSGATQGANSGVQKRQRLELLTQIKYTLIYDERIDKPEVDKILSDYEKKLKQQAQEAMQGDTIVAAKEGATGETLSEVPAALGGSDCEGAQSAITIPNDDQQQLLLEIVEEEKLDEQAAKKEEIEAAEDEAAGIMPKPMMMVQPMASGVVSEDDDDDDIESEDDLFN